jgi:hypothetical protein
MGIDNSEDLDVLGRIMSDWILRKYDLEGVDWPDVTEHRGRWRALVNR